jgi:hypothetical protein
MTDSQADQMIAWIAIGLNLVAYIVLFLKGRFVVIILSVAAAFLSPVPIFGTYWHHIITEPLRWWPLIAIFRLAKPSSRWADWFYSEPKMQLSRARYPTANPVPRHLRKEAVRNLAMIDKAAKTGGWRDVKELLRQRPTAKDQSDTQP